MSARDREEDLDHVVEQTHVALGEFVKGDHEPLERLYSRGDDVTLGNPFGPFVRGFDRVSQTMQRAAANYRDGEATGFELVSKQVTPELACFVEVEGFTAKVGGSQDITPISLRVTSIYRREGAVWRLTHRHADPITADRPAESVIQT